MLPKLSFDEFPSATYFSMKSFNSKEFLHFLTSLIFNNVITSLLISVRYCIPLQFSKEALFILKSLHYPLEKASHFRHKP